jgi:hypothetical protein
MVDLDAVKAGAKAWRAHGDEYGLDADCAHEALDWVDALVAEVERLRGAARWLASNPPETPVPDWVDAAVNAAFNG